MLISLCNSAVYKHPIIITKTIMHNESIDGSGIPISDTEKLEAMIHLLGLLTTTGKYLPLMIAGFATLNLVLAYFDLFVWGHIAPGIFNAILAAAAAFIFLGQLLKRHKIHRYEYRYRGRHLNRQPIKELERKRAEVIAAD
jgi:hypothetical protein